MSEVTIVECCNGRSLSTEVVASLIDLSSWTFACKQTTTILFHCRRTEFAFNGVRFMILSVLLLLLFLSHSEIFVCAAGARQLRYRRVRLFRYFYCLMDLLQIEFSPSEHNKKCSVGVVWIDIAMRWIQQFYCMANGIDEQYTISVDSIYSTQTESDCIRYDVSANNPFRLSFFFLASKMEEITLFWRRYSIRS